MKFEKQKKKKKKEKKEKCMKRLITFHAIAFATERSKTCYNKEIRLKISYRVIACIYARYSFKFRKRDFSNLP